MIHVVQSKVARRYADYFIRHIQKFDDLVAQLEKPFVPTAHAAPRKAKGASSVKA